MMNAAFEELDLGWRYLGLPIPPALFADTVRALPGSGHLGANVTVPHKVAAHGLSDARTEAAEAIGAVNTLSFRDGRIEADNTDAGGLLDALEESPEGRRALVLGAGGSARAAVWALTRSGAEVFVWNRTAERARELAGAFGADAVERPQPVEIVVNATSVGLEGEDEAAALAALSLESLEPPPVLADLVYGAEPTGLCRWAARGGSRVVDGIEVLVRQGARSLERWIERPAPVETMRLAARAVEPASRS
jgi:shikimate dehydrogenase